MKPQENVSFGLKNIMPGTKKLWEEHFFSLEKLFFLPSVKKNNHFSKSSPQSFSVPGIMFPARRNIYSPFSQQQKNFFDRIKNTHVLYHILFQIEEAFAYVSILGVV